MKIILFGCWVFLVLFANISFSSEEANLGLTGGRKLTKSTTVRSAKSRPPTSILSDIPLDLWCFEGLKPHTYRLFSSVELQLNLSTNGNNNNNGLQYEIYQNINQTALYEEQQANRRFFGIFRKVVLWKSRQISPFQRTFVGIETAEPYEISIKITTVDYVRFGVFVAGIFLFFFAKTLARNAVFYYSSGASVGLLASLLIVVFVVYKFLPRRSMAFSVLIGGWSFSLYLLYCVWQNLYSVLMEYQKLVAAYLVTVLLISFAVCYRYGPLTDPKSQNLSQWGLQLVGLLLIYASCQISQISLATCVAIFVTYNIPPSLLKWLDRILSQFSYRMFPPKRKLLTQEEYMQEGSEYTKKALEDLRKYCKSPKCDAWKLTTKLESPTRFASFIEGDSHLDDDELLNYDSDPFLARDLSQEFDESDEDSSDDTDSSISEARKREEYSKPDFATFSQAKSAEKRYPHISRTEATHSEGRYATRKGNARGKTEGTRTDGGRTHRSFGETPRTAQTRQRILRRRRPPGDFEERFIPPDTVSSDEDN